jgi:quinol-cytochrome oxidoreductase complex cytochrome b subunit
VRIVRWTALGLLTATLVAATGLLVSGAVLYGSYQPDGGGEVFLQPTSVQRSVEWVQREDTAAAALTVLGLLAAVACVVALVRSRRPAWLVAALTGLLAAGTGLLSGLTATAVRWDQVGLWAVTVGADIRGYRAPFDNDLVRFTIVDGSEVAPADQRLMVGLHLGAALIGLSAVLVGLVVAAVWGRRRQDVWRSTQAAISSTADTASGNAG